MHLGRTAIVAWLWVVATTVGGVALVLFGARLLSIVGVIAIILGLISIMPALMYTLEDDSELPV